MFFVESFIGFTKIKGLEKVLRTFLKSCQIFVKFVRIDPPMYFLEAATPGTPPKYFKQTKCLRIFQNYDLYIL